jgi:AraC-like DNA-binding protein
MSTSCSHYFRETIRGAERCGLDGDRLLADIGLNRKDIEDPAWRGRSEHLARLVQLVWLALGDEFMGFTEHRCKTGVFAMILHGVIAEDSIERALWKAIKFYGLITDDIRMQLDLHEDEAVFRIVFDRPDLDPSQYFREFWLSIWYRTVCWMAGAVVPLRRVSFSYSRPEVRIEEFKYMFPAVYSFDAPETQLVFDRTLLRQPIKRTKEELKHMLSVAPLAFMMIPSDVISYERQVRNLLLPEKKVPLEFPDFNEVAAHFNMIEQTLRRKLKQEGTSYRAIKENIRRDFAIAKLIRGNLSVSKIAEILGYSETRPFTRAFHEWTGMSPVQYREHFHRHLERREGTGPKMRGSV